MMTQACLSADLIARIRARISEDWRRTGDGDWLRMPNERRPKPNVDGLMGTMLGALFSYEPPDMQALKPVEPLSAKAIAKIEKALGFALPGDLRQLYLEIGDGGFGPYNGVRRLSNWAKDYQKLRAEPIGEKQRAWPAELLPIVYLNGHRVCMNRNSGAIVRWTKPPARCSEAKWTESFAPQSSLGGMARALGRHADADRRRPGRRLVAIGRGESSVGSGPKRTSRHGSTRRRRRRGPSPSPSCRPCPRR